MTIVASCQAGPLEDTHILSVTTPRHPPTLWNSAAGMPPSPIARHAPTTQKAGAANGPTTRPQHGPIQQQA